MQKILKLQSPRSPGQPAYKNRWETQLLNHPVTKTPVEKLFVDLLKRQCLDVMAALTECPPDTIPAHRAGLDRVRDAVRFAISHGQVAVAECRLSGGQLSHPATLADYLSCLDLTRKDLRSPSFVTVRDMELEKLNHKIDLLAGLFANSRALNAVLDEESEGEL